MKTAERFVLRLLKSLTSSSLDPLQFAYRAKFSTEDAILFSLDKLYLHLEHSRYGNSARILYFDFSSAFNTIQPVILGRKLIKMDLPPNFVIWIIRYLTERSQCVYLRSSESRSSLLNSNTGAPQGTVLAPFLFTAYTADFRICDNNCILVKFADDTALIRLIRRDNSMDYVNKVKSFVDYCVS